MEYSGGLYAEMELTDGLQLMYASGLERSYSLVDSVTAGAWLMNLVTSAGHTPMDLRFLVDSTL